MRAQAQAAVSADRTAADLGESVIPDGRLRPLTATDRLRYSRNALVPEVGVLGQQRIRAARVLLIGAGALGSPAALYLAAAGVGRLGIVDDDVVEVSNLQRQVLHTTAGVGQDKTESARQTVEALNPDVEVVTYKTLLRSDNALEIMRGWDVVVDGTDNFPTRYLVNDACVMLGLPLVHGAVFRSDGQVSVFDARRGPCYRCVHPVPPDPGSVPSCAQGGVLGVMPGVVGTMQATEAIKLVVGGARPLIGRMLMVNAWQATTAELPLRKNPRCPVCGEDPTVRALIDYEAFCGLPGARSQTGVTGEGPASEEITAERLRARLAEGEVLGQDLTVLDVREPVEVALDPFPGALHIPLAQVVQRADELDPDRQTVVLCAKGVRSARAIQALRDAGYTGRLTNAAGGMAAWNEGV
ncbi:molybdopterin-synthase adenylyltransferase MoeB [Actinomyces faecalis]|uniref:molybdopterin-synthase adenylyltransferase MoeB n=1 Tax=Actinomyces faecalis TaxID=2722820 RepID=UPI00155592B5|nr:molybdopterin-synthase adenylyltransferase MoeB [Actinomyces faecalis]